MGEIIWTPTSLKDVRGIVKFIAADSPKYALIIIDRLDSAVIKLAANPKAGKVVPEYKAEQLREIVVGLYRIIYWLNVREEDVYIVTVHHAKRMLRNNPALRKFTGK